jgi:hypothetical protein
VLLVIQAIRNLISSGFLHKTDSTVSPTQDPANSHIFWLFANIHYYLAITIFCSEPSFLLSHFSIFPTMETAPLDLWQNCKSCFTEHDDRTHHQQTTVHNVSKLAGTFSAPGYISPQSDKTSVATVPDKPVYLIDKSVDWVNDEMLLFNTDEQKIFDYKAYLRTGAEPSKLDYEAYFRTKLGDAPSAENNLVGQNDATYGCTSPSHHCPSGDVSTLPAARKIAPSNSEFCNVAKIKEWAIAYF